MNTVSKEVGLVEELQQCLRLYQSKNFQACIELSTSVLEHSPESIDAKYFLAISHMELDNNAIALPLLEECCSKFSGSPEAHFFLANLYAKIGRKQDAVNTYNHILKIDPNHIGALNNIANIYNEAGKNELALHFFHKILQLGSAEHHYITYNNIALIYKRVGLLNEALSHILKAIELKEDVFESHYNAAIIYIYLANKKKAIDHYARAFELQPNRLNLVLEYHEALGKVCDWQKRKELDLVIEKLIEGYPNGNTPELMTDIQKNANPQKYLESARRYTENVVANIRQLHKPFDHSGRNTTKTKLRVGYMSSDIKDHPVAHLMRGVFQHHDKNQFEIYLYSFSKEDNSGYKEAIEGYCDKFIDVKNVSNYETAKRIFDDKIDILIDLNGHTGTARVEALALEPAPVQVNYLGYIGTMGADFIDYVIVDKIVAPKEHQSFYTEKFVYLPDCYQANDNNLAISSDHISRQDEGLPEDAFIFCSFNQTYKIEPVMFECWMNILKRVPDSVLWLYCGSIFKDDTLAVENLQKEAKAHGVAPERLIFTNLTRIDKHLKRTALADIALDTRLYNGGTITSQTLWAGVPVVTLEGKHFASRMASSILQAVGFKDLVCSDIKSYENLAVDLAQNPSKVQELKKRLEKNRLAKPLFNTALFTKNLEKSYQLMWERYCAGDKPEIIEVPPLAS